MTFATESIHDFPSVLAELDINPSKLGCVMLPVRFDRRLLGRLYAYEPHLEGALYTSPEPERFWIRGDVTADAHITLLYGLLRPAWEQQDLVYRLLGDWRRPAMLPVRGYDAFPSPYENEPYRCIVARIGDPDGVLAEAHARLSYLPHVDTHPTYLPHATVAYVHDRAADRWLEALNDRHIVGSHFVDVVRPGPIPALRGQPAPVPDFVPAFDLGRAE